MGEAVILLVDDAPEIGLILRHLARRAGQAVVSCLTAEAGWDYLNGAGDAATPTPVPWRRPDLLLLDVNLPGMSGVELCQRVRADERLAGLPIALLGHLDRPDDLADALEAGVDFVVPKDLVCRAEAWQERLGEILAAGRGRPRPLSVEESLEWSGALPFPNGWAGAVNRALQHSSLWGLGPRVLRVMLLRAAQLVGPDFPPSWLTPDGLRLAEEGFPRGAPPAPFLAFVFALAQQLWCVLGPAASAPFREALALPSFPRNLSR